LAQVAQPIQAAVMLGQTQSLTQLHQTAADAAAQVHHKMVATADQAEQPDTQRHAA
jgi:hypothetical protein